MSAVVYNDAKTKQKLSKTKRLIRNNEKSSFFKTSISTPIPRYKFGHEQKCSLTHTHTVHTRQTHKNAFFENAFAHSTNTNTNTTTT